jgi:outer membrane protein OmpA-like peptidoglycan-associated protein
LSASQALGTPQGQSIRLRAEDTPAFLLREAYLKPSENWRLEASLRLEETAGAAGLAWGVHPSGRPAWVFWLRADGWASVQRLGLEGEEEQIPWQKALRPLRAGRSVRLSVEKRGWMLYFAADGKEWGKLPFARLGGSWQGVCAAAGSSLALEYFEVAHPPLSVQVYDSPLLKARRAPLDSAINMRNHHEFAPLLSPDGRRLLFSRAPLGVLADSASLWEAQVAGDSAWLPARPVARFWEPWQEAFPQGSSLALSRRSRRGGSALALLPWQDSLRQAVSLPLPAGTGRYGPGAWFLSLDQSLLIFARDSEEGFGEQDLYVCFRQGTGDWSKPLNLGPQVNSFGREFSPWLSEDRRELYFASDGQYGYGQSDIYISRRLDETWTRWSPPQNLGPRVNSPGEEGWYRPLPGRPDHVYMASTDSLRGEWNLYGLRIPDDPARKPLALLRLEIRGREGEALAGGRVLVRRLGPQGQLLSEEVVDAPEGRASVYLPLGALYELLPVVPGHYPQADTLNLKPATFYRELSRTLWVSRPLPGQTIRLERVYFERASAQLLAESYPELERLAALLASLPEVKIELQGHTDNIGQETELQSLSERRAEAVRQALIARGIAAERLSSKGFGSQRPVADNRNPETRPLNRRVELYILPP